MSVDRDTLLKAIRSARFALDLLHDIRDERPGAFLYNAEECLLDAACIVRGLRRPAIKPSEPVQLEPDGAGHDERIEADANTEQESSDSGALVVTAQEHE